MRDNAEKAKFPQVPYDDDQGLVKSEKPRNKRSKNDEIIKEIIEKEKRNGDDIAMLEEELLAVEMDHDEEHFEPLLPQINEDSRGADGNHQWGDVDSDQLLNVYDSFSEDPDLNDDPNIPSFCPPLDFDAEDRKRKNSHEQVGGSPLKSKNKVKLM